MSDSLTVLIHLTPVRTEVDDFDPNDDNAYFHACDQARDQIDTLLEQNRFWDVFELHMLEIP